MSDKYTHKRDLDPPIYVEHQRDEETFQVPRWLEWTFISINRVGFPVVAFFFMWYISSVSLKSMTTALEKQSLDLETLILTVNANHSEGKQWREQMLVDIREVRNKLR